MVELYCCYGDFEDITILFDDEFDCFGNESSIFDCLVPRRGEMDCSHDEDLYIYCKGIQLFK